MTFQIREAIRVRAKILASEVGEVIVSRGYNVKKGSWALFDIEDPKRVGSDGKTLFRRNWNDYKCIIGYVTTNNKGLRVEICGREYFERLKEPLKKFLSKKEKEGLDFKVDVTLVSEEPYKKYPNREYPPCWDGP